MKIVFVGGASGFGGALLDYLHSEGNDMFWISPVKPSGSVSFTAKCTHFPFRANDPGIPYVLESIGADAIVYLGAFDDTLRFDEGAAAGETMMGDLSSLLSLAQRFPIRQFVFLSSEEVFGVGADVPLTEEDEPAPVTAKGRFLASAERMLGIFAGDGGPRMLVARFGNVFGPQVSMPGAPGYVLSMCLSAVQGGEVQASPLALRQPVFITDAAEGLWALMQKEDAPSGVYQFAGNAAIADAGVGRRVCAQVPGCRLTKTDARLSLCLDSDKARDAVGYQPHHPLGEALDQTIAWARRYLARGEAPEAAKTALPQARREAPRPKGMLRTLFGVVRPYLENLLLLAIATGVTLLARDNTQLGSINFLLVYVVMVGAMYGKLQAALATLLATVAHLYAQSGGGSLIAVMLQYGQFVDTGVMFTLGMFVGHLRDRFALEEQAHQDELEHQTQQYDELMAINEANVSIKNALEQRLLGYGDSFAKIISIISELDMMEPQRVIQASVDVVRRIMRTEDVSIYQVAEKGFYARLAAASSPAAQAMGKSIRLESFPDMYGLLKDGDVYVNRQLAQGYPLMAAPVLVGERMVYIIMLWNMEFARLSPASVNLLTVMARLISASADRAWRYNLALRSERFIPSTEIMTPDAFAELLTFQEEGRMRGIHDYTVLRLSPGFAAGLELGDLSQRLTTALRDSDAIGMDKDGNILLLLASTSTQDADFVVNRLSLAGLPVQVLPHE